MENKPTPTGVPAGRPELTKSVLAQDVEITGSLNFKGELSFDGTIKGGHLSGSVLNVGEHATVEGNITADEVSISGNVRGNATVAQRCHLRASARLNGDLNTSRLIMEEGATFIGMSNITPRGAQGAPGAPKPPQP
jgi:cytoskeletal protein CcmA (bactofilin family)